MPGRAINNDFLKHVHDPDRPNDKCPWICLNTCNIKEAHYCIAQALANAKKGDLLHGYAFAGANAYRIDKILSVKELMTELVEGFEEAEK